MLVARIRIGERGSRFGSDISLVRRAVSPKFERGFDTRVIEVFGRVAHRPAQQSALGAQEPAFRSVHHRHGVLFGEERIRVGRIVGRRHILNARTHTDVDPVVTRLRKIGSPARILVGVHVHHDAGVRPQVLPRSTGRLRVERILTGIGREAQVLGIGVYQTVCSHIAHSLFGDAARFRLHTAHANGHPQFECIGEAHPQPRIALERADIEIAHQNAVSGRRERVERLHRRIQIVDHRHVDIALAVVRHREGAVLHLRIGNRTVGVGHAQHGRHAQDTGQLVNGTLAAGLGLDLEVIAVEIGECLLENIVVEFVRRIVGSDVLSLVGLHGRGVTAQFVGHKHIVHLRSIDLKMGDELHHRGKKNAHADVVAIQVVVRRAERFGIVIFEITGAGRGGEHGHTSRKTAEPTNYSVCFHLGQDFRIVTSQ